MQHNCFAEKKRAYRPDEILHCKILKCKKIKRVNFVCKWVNFYPFITCIQVLGFYSIELFQINGCGKKIFKTLNSLVILNKTV